MENVDLYLIGLGFAYIGPIGNIYFNVFHNSHMKQYSFAVLEKSQVWRSPLTVEINQMWLQGQTFKAKTVTVRYTTDPIGLARQAYKLAEIQELLNVMQH